MRATSLGEAYSKRAHVEVLHLHASPDLQCVNIFCAKVGQGCPCRLAASLEKLAVLSELDISSNALTTLPDSVFSSHLLSLNAASESHSRVGVVFMNVHAVLCLIVVSTKQHTNIAPLVVQTTN